MTEADLFAPRAGEVALDGPELLHDGYRKLELWRVTLPDAGGRGEIRQQREVLRAGPCVAVIAVDLERDEAVFIRQFRAPAALATGAGELVEIVAGRMEPGEDAAEAARRELEEETGLVPLALSKPLLTFLPTPGIVDEHATLFLARVDAGALPEHAGAADEHELTRPFAAPIDAAIASLDGAVATNAYLLIGLQWLALNRGRLRELLAGE
ncbi:NUDIX domain-containing protein [Methylopila turkensis]|uniref:GDP-mannose pyrophosphatase n=1 Tax=Methylopila turkensis TaxID=1437816 RepID=A0A9W6N6J1_9HYPH|nr:NUDIX domain-containing protein [Methylopila turkensis]GLK79513.1 ADP-ribose diphosphatase [Methylopila turkensis]